MGEGAPIARTYRLTPLRRLGNFWMWLFIRLGIGPRYYYLLAVRGRKSGRRYVTPVRIIENGTRYLVSPYGEVGWVKNLRVTGEVTLARGVASRRYRAVEVGWEEAAPVLKTYLTSVPITRPFFDVAWDSPIPAFGGEASRHPVFRLLP